MVIFDGIHNESIFLTTMCNHLPVERLSINMHQEVLQDDGKRSFSSCTSLPIYIH